MEVYVFTVAREPAKSRTDAQADGSTFVPRKATISGFATNESNDALMQNPGNDRAALAQFDRTFSTLYVGGPFTDSYQASRWRGGDGRTINPNFPFTGGDGFRNEYKDSGPTLIL